MKKNVLTRSDRLLILSILGLILSILGDDRKHLEAKLQELTPGGAYHKLVLAAVNDVKAVSEKLENQA